MKVQVETPSRLHFTLIDLHGGLGRVDGGVGVALETPGWKITVEPASEGLQVEGCPYAEASEVRELALKFFKQYPARQPLKIKVSQGVPRHVGLGSRTQLALGVAASLASFLQVEAPVRFLAQLMGRGGTSGIGVAAFEAGGVIVDGGHTFGPKGQKQSFLPSRFSKAPPPPVLARYYPPEDWFWVVAVPPKVKGAHGFREAEIFQKSCPLPRGEVEKVSRIVLMKLMPGLAEADIEAVGEALNLIQKVGFKKIEVRLAGRLPSRLMKLFLEQGAYGSGLSSFGPAVYALASGRKQAENLRKAALEFFEEKNVEGTVFKARTSRRGARIRRET